MVRPAMGISTWSPSERPRERLLANGARALTDAELVAILDRAAQLRLNAVVFQVRPGCDAFYVSELEPWSEYLSGQMGRPCAATIMP